MFVQQIANFEINLVHFVINLYNCALFKVIYDCYSYQMVLWHLTTFAFVTYYAFFHILWFFFSSFIPMSLYWMYEWHMKTKYQRKYYVFRISTLLFWIVAHALNCQKIQNTNITNTNNVIADSSFINEKILHVFRCAWNNLLFISETNSFVALHYQQCKLPGLLRIVQ